MSGAACSRCGALLRSEPRRGGSVVAGRVAVGVPPRLLPACPSGHPVDGTAALRRAASGLVLARRRPGHDRCGACRAPLDLPERSGRRALTVEPDGDAPFTLELALPLRRCPDCAVDNVPARDRRDLHRALTRVARGEVRPDSTA